MTILFMEGFDWTQSYLDLSRKWYAVSLSSSPSTAYGRFSGSNGISTSAYQHYMSYYLPAAKQDVYSAVAIGFAYYENNVLTPTYAANYPLLTLRDKNGTAQLKLHVVGNDIQVRDGADSLLDTIEDVHYFNTWTHLQVYLTISATTGVVKVWVNSNLETDLSNQDTKNGTDYVDGFLLRQIYNCTYTRFDDLWFSDGTCYGDCRIRAFFPDSDETYSQFAPSAGNNYENVDEVNPDDDTTYNQSNTLGHKDSFGVTPTIGGEIKAIQVQTMARNIGTYLAKIKNLIRSGCSDYNSSEELQVGPAYQTLVSVHGTDPADSNPWTAGKLTAAEFGYEITAMTTTTTTSTTTTV